MTGRDWAVGFPGFYGHRAIRRAPDGGTFTTLEPAVPIIPDIFVNSVIYLYPTSEDAERGTRYGGSGCLVSIPTTNPDFPYQSTHLYAVSNVHVVRDMDFPSPVIRFNRPVAGMGILELTPDDWRPSPTGDDVAVCEINIDFSQVRVAGLGLDTFITPERLDGSLYGLGNECFMIGRYIDVDGRESGNRPVVRFGNLARDTTEMLFRDDGTLQESYLVEMRSLSGFSGSPAWIWNDGVELFGKAGGREDKVLMAGHQPVFLGIDWCHLPLESPVLDRKPGPLAKATGDWTTQNSGMAGVVPAMKIRELLEDPELADEREEDEREAVKVSRPATGVSDARRRSDDEEPTAYRRDDFMRDLTKATRPVEQPEREG